MTSNYRRGYEGEYRVRKLYEKVGYDLPDRNRQDTPNHNLPDISVGPFSIEVKKGTGKGSYRWKGLEKHMHQAEMNCQEGTWAVLHHWDGAGSPKLVTMYESDFAELVESYRGNTR